MAKVLITYEAEASSLKATVAEVNKANDDVVKSAQESSKKAADAYKQTAQAAAQAFGNGQISGAIKALDKEVSGLVGALKLNVDELKKFDEKAKATNKIIIQSAQDVSKYEDRLRELSLAGQRQTKEFDDIAKAIGEYRSAIIAADRAVDLYAKSTDAATGRIGELEDKLYDLALAGQTNSKEFRELVGEVAKVRRAVIETDAQVDALAQRGSAITGLVQSVELLGAGFQAVEGAAALLGDENEDLQQTLVKLQAIMAITSAIEQGRVIITEQLAAKTGILGAAMKLYSFVTAGATTATKAWRAVLVTTGFGALIVGLGLLIEKLVGSGDAAKKAAEDVDEYQKAIDRLNSSASKALTGAANAQIELQVKQGKLTEEAAARLVVFNNLQTQLSDLAVETKEKEAEAFKRFEEQKAKDLEQFSKVTKTTEDQLSKDLKIIQEQRALSERDIRARAQLEVLSINEEAENKRKEAAKKRAEEEAKIERAKRDSLNKLRQEVADAQLELDKKINEQLKAQQKKLEFELSDIADTSLQTQLDTRVAFLKRLELEEGTSIERRVNILELEAKSRQAAIRESVNDFAQANQLILLDQAETQKAIAELRRVDQQRQIEEAFAVVNQIVSIFNTLNQLSAQVTENRIAGINEASQAELAAIDNSTKTERQKQREREALELRTSRRIAQEKIKQAKLDKSTALFGAVISTAESIVKTGANLGYPAAIPFQVLAGILGAAQIATIAARPIPKFAKGGEVGGRLHSQGGTLIEAERGEFVTNRRQASRHRQELDAINTSTAAFQKLINERYVRPAIQNFMLSGRDKSVTVNASLNSKSMEREIKAMRKSMRKPVVINLSSSDQRYTWQ